MKWVTEEEKRRRNLPEVQRKQELAELERGRQLAEAGLKTFASSLKSLLPKGVKIVASFPSIRVPGSHPAECHVVRIDLSDGTQLDLAESYNGILMFKAAAGVPLGKCLGKIRWYERDSYTPTKESVRAALYDAMKALNQ